MSHVPPDPTKPADPLLVSRRRPDTVTLAVVLMMAGAVLGLLNAVLVIAGTGTAAGDFQARAGLTAATPEQIEQITTALAAWSMTAGLTGLVLSVVMVMLALRVFRGSQAARVASLTLVTVSILCGLGWSSFAVRGGSTTLRPDGMDEETGRGIADALGLSTSGMSTYVVGGLTCLQVLGYIAVIGLLLWPASNAYFRRSRTTWSGRRSRITWYGRRSRTTEHGRRSRTTWYGRRSRTPEHARRSGTTWFGQRIGTTWFGQRIGTTWFGRRRWTSGYGRRRWTTMDGRRWAAEYGRRRWRAPLRWRKRPESSDPTEQ
jgi:hypothetical protein